MFFAEVFPLFLRWLAPKFYIFFTHSAYFEISTLCSKRLNMNNTSYNASPSMKKITDLNADMANEFVKNKLFCFEERVNREKALITTSQIRKFLSTLNCLENKISFCEKELVPEIVNEIKYLKHSLFL